MSIPCHYNYMTVQQDKDSLELYKNHELLWCEEKARRQANGGAPEWVDLAQDMIDFARRMQRQKLSHAKMMFNQDREFLLRGWIGVEKERRLKYEERGILSFYRDQTRIKTHENQRKKSEHKLNAIELMIKKIKEIFSRLISISHKVFGFRKDAG